MNYGQIKLHTLRLLDEFSSSGVVQTTQDVLVKIMELTNDGLMDLAATTAKIHSSTIHHAQPSPE